MSSIFSGKRVLVAGATGFIGTHLVIRIEQLGAKVRGTFFNKKPYILHDNVSYVSADLTQLDDCLRVTSDMDYVFMAAANSSGAAVMEKTPLVHLTPNVVMNAHMLAAAYENGVKKFCFISSNTVYPVTDFPVKEDDANFEYFDKYFIVGWMKRFSEIMCEMYTGKIRNPMKTLVVRPGNLYGPYDKYTWTESKVIAALIRRAVERCDPFEVWGDGYDIKDFLYIDDFIDGLLVAFEKINDGLPVNIASGEQITIRQVISKVLAAADYQYANVVYDASKPTMIPKRLIDVSRMQHITGWTPQTSIVKGLENTIHWYRTQYASQSPEMI